MSSSTDLFYQVQLESDIIQDSRFTKLSYRPDASYFKGRAGLIRIVNLVLGLFSLCFMWTGYYPRKLDREDASDELIRMMKGDDFSGYQVSNMTSAAIALGASASGLSLVSIISLHMFMEVRCDLFWEKVNQKAQVVACLLSIMAAFCDVMSIQEIQGKNCRDTSCQHKSVDSHNTGMTKEDEFYPPYFFYHYSAFIGFLSNAMLYSIASRIWLRNED